MSYMVKDSLGGKRVALVYDAGWISLPAGGGRLGRSRQAGRHMRKHRARAGLFLRAGEMEHWWAARSPGVLFAAGIMQWLYSGPAEEPLSDFSEDGTMPPADNEKPGDFRVVIPLDSRVYVCTVVGRMIEEERVLPLDQAFEQIEGEDSSGSAGIPVYAWQAGDRPADTAGAVDEMVPLEPAPFEIQKIQLKPLWLAFARGGMVHASHFVLSVLMVFLLLSSQLLRPAMEIVDGIDLSENPVESIVGIVLSLVGLRDEPEVIVEAPEMREIVPDIPDGASAELRRLAAWIVTAEGLYGDGISSFQWNAGTIDLGGSSPPREYPFKAEELAMQLGGEFRITPKGWFLSLPDDMPRLSSKNPQIDSGAVIQHLSGLPHDISFKSGPDRVPSRIDHVANTFTSQLVSTSWQLNVKETAVGELLMLAESLDGWPGVITGASCTLGSYRMHSCQISLEITSL